MGGRSLEVWRYPRPAETTENIMLGAHEELLVTFVEPRVLRISRLDALADYPSRSILRISERLRRPEVHLDLNLFSSPLPIEALVKSLLQ